MARSRLCRVRYEPLVQPGVADRLATCRQPGISFQSAKGAPSTRYRSDPPIPSITRASGSALDSRVSRFRAARERLLIRIFSIGDVEAHAVGRQAMSGSELRCLAIGLCIDDKRDPTLAVQGHVFVRRESRRRESKLQKLLRYEVGFRRREFGEGKTVQAREDCEVPTR